MKISDEWQTPQWLFDELNKEFNFTGDLCAQKDNAKCKWFTNDIFWANQWPDKQSYFMNPPYSKPKMFIEKAWEIAFKFHNNVVMVLKCDTSTSWWGIFWDYLNHKPKENVEIRFLSKRLRFVRHDKKLDNANFPSCIVILRGRELLSFASSS